MTDYRERAIDLLKSAPSHLPTKHAVIGLDGFVDSIIRVVSRKNADGSADHFEDITEFAQRVNNAAGKSAALEMHIQQVKLGGNGPIMANAMLSFGSPLTYIGAVGDEGDGIHPVFQPMTQLATVVPIVQAACTDALEFDDGKLMFQKMECLDDLDYDAIVKEFGEQGLIDLFEKADFVALNHWSSLPHMTDIWKRLLSDICPKLSDKPRHIFFDLADPIKRDHGDIREALETIGKFQEFYDTTLGLNEKEGEHICEVLDCESTAGDHRALMKERAANIRDVIGIGSVVVHPVAFAAAADENGTAVVDGAYTPKPLISTGAGDHFNAGYFLGRCLGGDIEAALQIGVATSGYYVRTAISPSTRQLADFIKDLD